MSKHTPGPWKTEQSSRTDIYIISQSVEARNKWVATACNHEFHPTEENNKRNQYNARLIAAAPELLEACHALLRVRDAEEWVAALRAAIEQARAAIDKAEGVKP